MIVNNVDIMTFSVECIMVIKTYFQMKSYIIVRKCFRNVCEDKILIPNLTIEYLIDRFVNAHHIDDAPYSGR